MRFRRRSGKQRSQPTLPQVGAAWRLVRMPPLLRLLARRLRLLFLLVPSFFQDSYWARWAAFLPAFIFLRLSLDAALLFLLTCSSPTVVSSKNLPKTLGDQL